MDNLNVSMDQELNPFPAENRPPYSLEVDGPRPPAGIYPQQDVEPLNMIEQKMTRLNVWERVTNSCTHQSLTGTRILPLDSGRLTYKLACEVFLSPNIYSLFCFYTAKSGPRAAARPP